MTLQRHKQRRYEWSQALSTDPVSGLPEHHQCLASGVVVTPNSRTPGRLRARLGVQRANGMLSMPPRHGHKLIENPSLLFVRPCSISLSNCDHEFTSRLPADLALHSASGSPPSNTFHEARGPCGNRSRGNATGQSN